MAVFRVERNSNYTTMSNYHLRDSSLSLKAKGLLSVFLSLPDEWHYSISGLTRITKEGKGSLTTTVRELEKAGYLIRNQKRLKNGKIGEIEYVIFERPQEKAVNSCGVRLVRYGDGATDRDAARPKEQPDAEEEEAADEDFEWDMEGQAFEYPDGSDPSTSGRLPEERMAGTALPDSPVMERPSAKGTVMEKPSAKDPAMDGPALGRPVTGNPAPGNWEAGNPAMGKWMTENPAAENPAGLITDGTITDKSNTDGINERGIGNAQQLRRYGSYGNVFLTDSDLARLRSEFPSDYMRRIERLSEYMASSGKRYEDHLSTIERWARWDSEKPVQGQVQGKPYSHERYRYREGESL